MPADAPAARPGRPRRPAVPARPPAECPPAEGARAARIRNPHALRPAAHAGPVRPGRGRRPAGPRLRVVRVRRPAAGAPDAVRVLPHVLHTTGEEADRVR